VGSKTSTLLHLLNTSAVGVWDVYSGWIMQETPRKYMKPTHPKSDLREDPRLDGKVMWRCAAGLWGSGRLRPRIFSTFGTVKVVRSSSLRTGRLYPRSFLVLIFSGRFDSRAHGSVGSYGKNPQRHHWGSIPRHSD
jgi:hypothetical protein